jgi:hypothetical protein
MVIIKNVIAYWLHDLLFFSVTAWVFGAVYGIFGCVVVYLWWRYPPKRLNKKLNSSLLS